ASFCEDDRTDRAKRNRQAPRWHSEGSCPAAARFTGRDRRLLGARVRTMTAQSPRNALASCGNVFADLRVPNPGEAPAKAELAGRICALLSAKKLTQSQAASVLGVDQPKVSDRAESLSTTVSGTA